tara:strand:- start:117 stop:557 length:441 start_codon:yes stop_codon:yes gene_type:complete
MTKISNEIRSFVNFQKLGYVATVASDNTPNLSPKGTIMAIDESHLAFADIRSPQTIENLRNNSSIEINVVDPIRRKGFRFKGSGIIIDQGKQFEEILEQYKKNGIKSKINAIVIVSVETINEVTSPSYDLGVTEDELVLKWKKYYQ